MGQVTINGNTYDVMGTLPDAKVYLGGAVGDPAADAWLALADDNLKSARILRATRILKNLPWQGTPTVTNQDTAFPRNGVTGVTDGTTPEDLTEAEYELAALLTTTPAIATSANTGSNTKRLEAGPVNIEYFRPTDIAETATPLPKPVWDRISKYMALPTITAARAYGVDPCEDEYAQSQFEDCDTYERTIR